MADILNFRDYARVRSHARLLGYTLSEYLDRTHSLGFGFNNALYSAILGLDIGDIAAERNPHANYIEPGLEIKRRAFFPGHFFS